MADQLELFSSAEGRRPRSRRTPAYPRPPDPPPDPPDEETLTDRVDRLVRIYPNSTARELAVLGHLRDPRLVSRLLPVLEDAGRVHRGIVRTCIHSRRACLTWRPGPDPDGRARVPSRRRRPREDDGELEADRLARRGDPPTSQAAAAAVVAEGLPARLHHRAAELVARFPGLTARELTDAAAIADPQVLSRRLGEADRFGLLRRGERRTCRVTGAVASTWWPLG